MSYINIVYKPIEINVYRGIERFSPFQTIMKKVGDDLSLKYCSMFNNDGLIPYTRDNFIALCNIRDVLLANNIETDILVYDVQDLIISDILSFIGFDVCGDGYHSFLVYDNHDKDFSSDFDEFHCKLNHYGLFDDILIANKFAEYVKPYSINKIMEYDTNIKAITVYMAK